MQNKRILITGGTGFLGRHLVREFRKAHYTDVVAVGSRDFDLREEAEVIRMFETIAPQIVIHLAARVGGIGANREHPAEFFYDNIRMGIYTLHHAWRFGCEKFVAIGTVCAYPKFTPVPFKEDDLWNGYPEETNAPYGLAKKMLLVQAQAYRQQYDFNAIYLLPVNLYGPEDNFDLESSHVIPALIRKFLEAVENHEPEVVVWGTGKASREFLYVEDAARAIRLATERYNEPDPVNIGSGFEIPIRELVNIIAELTGFKGQIRWDTSKPDGQPRRRLDTTRAMEAFGFKAQIDFYEGLKRTIEWYKKHRSIINSPTLT